MSKTKMCPSWSRGTMAYVQGRYWNTLNQRSVNGRPQRTPRNESYFRRGTRLEFTKVEFCAWVSDHWPEFQAIYESGRTPSIDRVDNSKNYSLDNIQVIDLRENMAKDRRKPVKATNKETGEVRQYPSARDAARADGFDWKLISSACLKGFCHKGWKWEFVK